MGKNITIGELAKLMDVSIHQIRYFEEKEILLPDYIDENGYRMYGIDQIYTLSHILLLRKLNISTSEIKKQFSNFSPNDYSKLLKNSIKDIENQIGKLVDLKNKTEKIVDKMRLNDKYINRFVLKDLKKRNLSIIKKTNLNFSFTARNLYKELYKSKKVDDIYNKDFITLIDEKNLFFCLETEIPENYTLKSGKYLSYQFFINQEDDLNNSIEKFFKYSEDNHIKLTGQLIEIENSEIAMFYNKKLLIELQMMIY